MRQAGMGPEGLDPKLANDPQFQQQRTQQLNSIFQAMPGARAVYAQYPGQFDALVGLAMGDIAPKNFPTMLRKGVYQIPTADAESLVRRTMNPDYNSGLYQQKQNLLTAYTDPKNPQSPSAQMIAFNNFIRHGDDLYKVLKPYQATNSPLLNQSLTWLRQNTGDPEVEKLLTALEPPLTEYKNFLNGNRALDDTDKKDMAGLLDVNKPVGVMVAFLQQAVPTAMDRLSDLNQPWKQRFHEDFPDTIYPEAKTALEDMGMGGLADKFTSGGFIRGTTAPVGGAPPTNAPGPRSDLNSAPAGATGVAPGSDGKFYYHDAKGTILGPALPPTATPTQQPGQSNPQGAPAAPGGGL
jgi:hypothetical protein